MKKLINSICLVAGTAIGAGTIALPIALAKIGLAGSCALMLVTWWIGYYSALMGLELNLRARKGLTQGELGAYFSGPMAQWIGSASLLVLCYGLLCAYISGGSSVLFNISQHMNMALSQEFWMAALCLFLGLILLYGISLILHVNKAFFALLLTGLLIMIIWLGSQTSFHFDTPLPDRIKEWESWTIAIPVLVTSFGFQVVFHNLYIYLEGDKQLLKKAFFWGSLIPALVYVSWTFSILLFIVHKSPSLYDALVNTSMSVGTLTGGIGDLLANSYAHPLIWMITLFAILTSLIGVGIALMGQIEEKTSPLYPQGNKGKYIAILGTILPASIITFYIPEVFIKALGFAGMILVVLAILLPLYLLFKSDTIGKSAHYPILNNLFLRILVLISGLGIIGTELFNMI